MGSHQYSTRTKSLNYDFENAWKPEVVYKWINKLRSQSIEWYFCKCMETKNVMDKWMDKDTSYASPLPPLNVVVEDKISMWFTA